MGESIVDYSPCKPYTIEYHFLKVIQRAESLRPT